MDKSWSCKLSPVYSVHEVGCSIVYILFLLALAMVMIVIWLTLDRYAMLWLEKITLQCMTFSVHSIQCACAICSVPSLFNAAHHKIAIQFTVRLHFTWRNFKLRWKWHTNLRFAFEILDLTTATRFFLSFHLSIHWKHIYLWNKIQRNKTGYEQQRQRIA